MAAIPPFTHVDFTERINAIRDVSFALGAGNANTPSNFASGTDINCLYYINLLRVQQALPPLSSLDYTGFVPALNVLAAMAS